MAASTNYPNLKAGGPGYREGRIQKAIRRLLIAVHERPVTTTETMRRFGYVTSRGRTGAGILCTDDSQALGVGGRDGRNAKSKERLWTPPCCSVWGQVLRSITSSHSADAPIVALDCDCAAPTEPSLLVSVIVISVVPLTGCPASRAPAREACS
jgi:hypothetical protein